jgi:DNA repair exonuclease SbcCD ATPase subunit
MRIEEFAFRNICSYGNKLQQFKFDDLPKLVLVQGKNGGGKSSISDALTISIYGKSAVRKTKEIPNRINKNAYTQIKFKTNTGDTVSIERGLEPNFSKLEINGVQHNLPDKRRVDEFIEDELTQIPFNVFSNTISLSVNDFKSFVKLSPQDKRKIIDKIFGLDILNEMSTLTKDETRETLARSRALQVSIDQNTTLLQNSTEQLIGLKTDVVKINQTRLDEVIEQIAKLETLQATSKEEFLRLKGDVQKIQAELTTVTEQKSKIRFTVDEINKKLAIYEKNKCPHCLSDLTDTVHLEIKTKLEAKRQVEQDKVPAIQTQINELAARIKELETLQNDAKSNHQTATAQIPALTREKTQLSNPTTTDSAAIERMQTIIDNIGTKLKELSSEKSELDAKLKLNQELDVILGDSGMKRLLMNQIIPILNKKILKIAKLLEFKFAFEFDLEFDPIITHLGVQVSPDSLSTGEQKKMNLIVLLCILELIKLKHHRVNLLFLDEVFSSLDVESIYRIVDLLKEFSKKYNMTIFVISHDMLPEELFDMKIFVENNDHFSDMKVVN